MKKNTKREALTVLFDIIFFSILLGLGTKFTNNGWQKSIFFGGMLFIIYYFIRKKILGRNRNS